jgi:hypothetical protein
MDHNCCAGVKNNDKDIFGTTDNEIEGEIYLALDEDMEQLQIDSSKSDRFWLPTGISITYALRIMVRYYWQTGWAYSFIGWKGQ